MRSLSEQAGWVADSYTPLARFFLRNFCILLGSKDHLTGSKENTQGDVMNYESAISKLTGRNREWRKLGNNTYLLRDADGSTLHVRLHNTNIMTFRPDGSVTLHSGGWRTVTTKARMNEYLSGWGISQERGQWYVTRQNPKYKGWEETPDEPFWERVCLFAEGITLRPDGTVEGGEPLENEKKNLTLRRRVHAFAASYMKAFKAGKVPAPSNGDCLYCNCLLKSQDGLPLGETVTRQGGSAEHILSHLKEKYYVPSLLARTLDTMPTSQVMRWAVAEKWDPQFKAHSGGNGGWGQDYAYQQLQKNLGRYLLRQLGRAA